MLYFLLFFNFFYSFILLCIHTYMGIVLNHANYNEKKIEENQQITSTCKLVFVLFRFVSFFRPLHINTAFWLAVPNREIWSSTSDKFIEEIELERKKQNNKLRIVQTIIIMIHHQPSSSKNRNNNKSSSSNSGSTIVTTQIMCSREY